jgi:hypothetical protein
LSLTIGPARVKNIPLKAFALSFGIMLISIWTFGIGN